MHHNAPIHRSRAVAEYLADELAFPTLDWPPYSPDLNLIENLWATLKRRLHKKDKALAYMPTNDESLRKLVTTAIEVWDEIPVGEVNAFIDSMPRRIASCCRAKGWYTKY